MTAVAARILLRYAAGALVTAGLLDADLARQIGTDPDVLVLIGGALGLAAETTYAVAKRLGWTT